MRSVPRQRSAFIPKDRHLREMSKNVCSNKRASIPGVVRFASFFENVLGNVTHVRGQWSSVMTYSIIELKCNYHYYTDVL